MGRVSAGVLLWRHTASGALEVLVAHPGGPFWARKHEGAWSIPKGEFEPEGEDPRDAAAREFAEETGQPLDVAGDWLELGEATLKSRKRIVAWGVEGDFEPHALVSNTFEMEWPPRSGRRIEVPEVDEVRWVTPGEARVLLNAAQHVFVDRLEALLEERRH